MPIIVKLDDLLYARRMTLTEVAERVGITLANLSKLKTGKVRAIQFSTLEALCEVLDCEPGDLLGYGKRAGAGTAPSGPADSPALTGQQDIKEGEEPL